jgi:hypothetical protein
MMGDRALGYYGIREKGEILVIPESLPVEMLLIVKAPVYASWGLG